MKNKNIKYDHVGRPSNKEIYEYNKKKKLKVIRIIVTFIVLIGTFFMYLYKDNINLDSLMGNSTYRSSMKKVQVDNKYKKIVFKPESYEEGYYYQQYKINTKKPFISSLFEATGHYNSRYKWIKIQIFSNGNYIKTITPKAKKLKITENFIGETLALKVFVQSKVSKRNYVKYLRLYITDGDLKNAVCTYRITNENNKFIWPIAASKNGKPLTTYISSGYSDRSLNGSSGFHYGLDISRGNNPSIIAAYDGIVTKVVNNSVNTYKSKKANYGTYVIIEHNYNGEKIYSIYGHMKYNSIPENIYVGAKVKTGTKIGTMGNTGYSSGTHLHFEMRKNDTKVETRAKNNVNPLDYINPNNPYPTGSWKCK